MSIGGELKTIVPEGEPKYSAITSWRAPTYSPATPGPKPWKLAANCNGKGFRADQLERPSWW